MVLKATKFIHTHKYQTIFFIDITAKISNRINIRRMFTVKKKKVQFFTQRMVHKPGDGGARL